MLYVEPLESRCLLSVALSDNLPYDLAAAPAANPNLIFADSLQEFTSEDAEYVFAMDFTPRLSDIVPVGDVYGPQAIWVVNNSDETINITDLRLEGDDFLLESDMEFIREPSEYYTYMSQTELTIGQQLASELDHWTYEETGETGYYEQWFYVSADQGQLLDVRTKGLAECTVDVYSIYEDYYGEPMVYGLLAEPSQPTESFATVQTFAAPYTGDYYLEVRGVPALASGQYQILVDESDDAIETIELPDEQLTLTGQYGVPGHLPDNVWFQFDADYGTQLTIALTDEPLVLRNVEIVNAFGELLYWADATEEGIDFTISEAGPYYLHIWTTSDYLSPTDYELTITTDSVYQLLPGEVQIFYIWFNPQHPGEDITNTLIIETDDGQPATEYTLSGDAIGGDLALTELDVTNQAVLQHVQSGKPMDISATLANLGPGDILDPMEIVFVLSTDDVFGDDNDITLGEPLTVEMLLREDFYILEASFDVPVELRGVYYVLAYADYDNLIDEAYEAGPGPLGETHESNLIVGERLIFSPDNSVVTYALGDIFEQQIDFGSQILASHTVAVVTVHNRGDDPITIASMGLAGSDSFVLTGFDNPGYDVSAVPITPHMSRGFSMVFTPESFYEDGSSDFADTLTLQTNEAVTHSLPVQGSVIGADLWVYEDSGKTPNDDLLEFGALQINNGITWSSFIIQNKGNQALYINDIRIASANAGAFGLAPAWDEWPLILGPYGSENDTQTVLVSFLPNELGDLQASVVIESNDYLGDYLISLAGAGTAPGLAVYEQQGLVNDDLLEFGWQPIGVPASTTLELVNEGTNDLVIYDWGFTNDIAGDFAVTPANAVGNASDDVILAPGASMNLTVSFLAPSDGYFTDHLLIHSNDLAGEYVVDITSLAGLSTQPALRFRYDEPSFSYELDLDFGNVPLGESLSKIFYINNNASVPLVIDNVLIEGGYFSLPNVADPTADIVLAQGQSMPMMVTLAAATNLGLGDYYGVITFDSNAPTYSRVSLSATLVTPDIDLSATYLQFDPIVQDTTATRTFDITNEGSSDLVLTNWSIDNNQFQLAFPDGALQYGQVVIAPGQTTQAAVTYEPTQYGSTFATLSLTSNDLDESTRTVSLAASSLGRPVHLAPNVNYAFQDSNGDTVYVRAVNANAVLLLQNGQLSGADIQSLQVSHTAHNSQLRIWVPGGDTSVGQISVDGSLTNLQARGVTLEQSLAVDGSLGRLTLTEMANGAIVDVADTTPRGMTVKVDYVAPQALLNLAGDVRSFQADQMDGLLLAQNIGRVLVRNDMDGDIEASANINSVISRTGNITGNITAGGNLGAISARQNLSATIRADNIRLVRATNLTNALISTRDDVDRVLIRNNVSDSYILAGYDIGMNALADRTDDLLSNGNIGLVRFGGQLSNSYFAAGVLTDTIRTSLGFGLAADEPVSSNVGSIGRVIGRNIITAGSAQEFGLYAADNIRTNLHETDNFVIIENI